MRLAPWKLPFSTKGKPIFDILPECYTVIFSQYKYDLVIRISFQFGAEGARHHRKLQYKNNKLNIINNM
jgi:hypothetical protein